MEVLGWVLIGIVVGIAGHFVDPRGATPWSRTIPIALAAALIGGAAARLTVNEDYSLVGAAAFGVVATGAIAILVAPRRKAPSRRP